MDGDEKVVKEGKCPVCGAKLLHREGCIECPQCGWSACVEA